MLGRTLTAASVRWISQRGSRDRGDFQNILKFVVNENQKMIKNAKAKQVFSNFLVMDFEATCNRAGPKPFPQEIIEFPVLNLSADTFEEVSRFHTYVRPDVHPELSDFCTELTGIMQSMVEDQPNLEETLKLFEKWLEDNGLNTENSIPVTFGNWDLATALKRQCSYLGIDVPPILQQWINIKYPIFYFWRSWPRGLSHCLEKAGLEFQGRAHSGIDDCTNIAQLLKYLGERNMIFKPTNKGMSPS
ncbi:ERI1 exoribonuclease 3 [Galendromus occidentalis]|uniref:ERI1 exoribonuclease 3 n=1 Tax=Galendromus occidentalis TaxID=34638 RepID=A0AAJ6QW50_9ACAR|nr:ERI1 exoribonuclease 3 [Galendromus occidentalis]